MISVFLKAGTRFRRQATHSCLNMCDLEQTIAELRRKMLAVGIKTPEPLEELEMQLRELREDLAQHKKLGLEEGKTSGSAGEKTGRLGF